MRRPPKNLISLFKIVLLGDGGVGKTSIRNRYFGKGFKSKYTMTLGADFGIKKFDNKVLQLWDLAGQPAFNRIRKSYYSGVHGALLVFSIVDQKSFNNLEMWLDEIEKNNGRVVPFILVANKIDLEHTQETVSDSDIDGFLEMVKLRYKVKCDFLRSSALTGENVQKMFDDLVDMITTD